MARVLILHALLGTGHLHASNALADAIRQTPAAHAEVIDVLDHANPVLRTAMTEFYRQTSERAPIVYKTVFEQSDTPDAGEAMTTNERLARLAQPFARDLERRVAESQADAVVCVHPVAGQMMRLMRLDGRLPQPFYVVVTDFLAHSTWLVDGVARYFLPTELTRFDLLRRGVADDVMVVTGIPIRAEVREPKSPAEARARHGLPLDRPVITLFGGGIEPQRVRSMVTGLLSGPLPGLLIVVAGRNAALMDAVADLSDGAAMALRSLGMIDYVDDLVVASDLVITKAGGLIVSEVLARGTPLVITEPIPGQEEWNADLVTVAGAGLQVRVPDMVPAAVLHLLVHPERRQYMREQALFIGRPNAAQDIAQRVLADVAASGNTVELTA